MSNHPFPKSREQQQLEQEPKDSRKQLDGVFTTSDNRQQQQQAVAARQSAQEEGLFDPFTTHALMWAYFKAFQSPLDRMKVLLQASQEVRASLTPYEKSLLPTSLNTTRGLASHIWRTEGFHGIWRGSLLGFGSSLAHTYGSVGVAMLINWLCQPKIGYAAYDSKDPQLAMMGKKGMYSLIFGLLLSVLLYPIEMIRLVRMMDLKFPQAGRLEFEYPRIRHLMDEIRAGKFIFRTVPRPLLEAAQASTVNALRYSVLGRGYVLSLCGMLTYRASHFFIGSLALNVAIREEVQPSAMTELGLGFGISMAATAFVYPLDVFRSRFIRAGFVRSPMPGGGDHIAMQDLAQMIWRHEGFRGFYRGASFALTVRAATLAGAAFGVPFLANTVSGRG